MKLILNPKDAIHEPSVNNIPNLKVSDFPMAIQNLINQVLNLGGRVLMLGSDWELIELFVEKS